ncbi:hypothetical protein [Roseateles sp.]|uniref:hypothetical protein n=1 Tax=Roseateles sp. TaxID=1971397 RepID=UPI003BAABF94
MADPTEMDLRDEASSLLGMASGLAHMCCGASEELGKKEPQDMTEVVTALRHVETLLGEAKASMAKSSAGAPQLVVQAHAVCSLVTVDIAVDAEGRSLQHWSDEITAWGLHALCDVIKRAKAAVDGPERSAVELGHG